MSIFLKSHAYSDYRENNRIYINTTDVIFMAVCASYIVPFPPTSLCNFRTTFAFFNTGLTEFHVSQGPDFLSDHENTPFLPLRISIC